MRHIHTTLHIRGSPKRVPKILKLLQLVFYVNSGKFSIEIQVVYHFKQLKMVSASIQLVNELSVSK